jgi:hypothetical protein
MYNTLGEKVKRLLNEEVEAEQYSIDFNAEDVASGVYFYRLQVYPANGWAGDPSTGSGQSFIATKKMILLK